MLALLLVRRVGRAAGCAFATVLPRQARQWLGGVRHLRPRGLICFMLLE